MLRNADSGKAAHGNCVCGSMVYALQPVPQRLPEPGRTIGGLLSCTGLAARSRCDSTAVTTTKESAGRLLQVCEAHTGVMTSIIDGQRAVRGRPPKLSRVGFCARFGWTVPLINTVVAKPSNAARRSSGHIGQSATTRNGLCCPSVDMNNAQHWMHSPAVAVHQ